MESRVAEARGALATTEPERWGATTRSATTLAGAGDGVEIAGCGTDGAVDAGALDAVSAGAAGWIRACPIGEIANATAIAETPAPAMRAGRRRIGDRSSFTSSQADGRSPSPERILA